MISLARTRQFIILKQPWTVLTTLVLTLLLSACSKHSNFYREFASGKGIVSTTPAINNSQLKANSTLELSWTIKDITLLDSLVIFEISTNAGTSWTEVGRSTTKARRYSLQVPDIESDQVQVRASYLDKNGSKSPFFETSPLVVDVNSPVVTLNSMNTHGIYKGGTTRSISWSAQDMSFTATPTTLFYSTDGGVSWQVIADNQPPTGIYSWTIPSINSSNVRIKVATHDVHGRSSEAVSTKPFTIDSTGPTLSVLSPGASESWNGLTNNTLSWTSSDLHPSENPITIEFSNDGGANYVVLYKKIKNTGSQIISSTDLAAVVDSTNCVIRITATDQAGNQTTAVSPTFRLSRNLPQLTLTQKRLNYANGDFYSFSGTCDRSASMSENPGVVVTPAATPMLPTTVSCDGVSDIGTWSFNSNQATDGSYEYSFSQTNNVSDGSATMTLKSTWIRDTVIPTVASLQIEKGAEVTTSPFVAVEISATDNSSAPLTVQLQEATDENASCLFDKFESFEMSSATASKNLSLRAVDGLKKICARVLDQAGNTSVMTLPTGDLGTNADTIAFEGNSPPTVDSFAVFNPTNQSKNFNAGDPVHISWAVKDATALATSPISLDYTLDGSTWIPLIKKYGTLGTGTKTYSDSYTHFSAPASYFMVRISVEDQAGNKSFRVNSAPLNAPNWSIFAGSLDNGIGGTPKTISFQNSNSTSQSIAVHPLTGDIFTVSAMGVVRFSPSAGTSELVIGVNMAVRNWADTGLSADGGSYTLPKLSLSFLSISFDNNGLLYVSTALSDNRSVARIYQLDLEKKTSRHYAGGGAHYDAKQLSGITAQDLSTHLGPIPFDEDNSLYMNVPCSTAGDAAETRRQLVKIPQLADGTPGAPTHVAGNCAAGNGVNNTLATETPFSTGLYYLYSSLVVRDRGQKIYLAPYGGAVYKIINGQHYTTSITSTAARGLLWSNVDNHLYVVHNSAAHDLIHKWANPGLAQTAGETSAGVVLSYKGTAGNCWEDDVYAVDACSFLDLAMAHDKNNNLFFLDGLKLNTTGSYRVRFIDPTGRVQTIAGTMPFFGKDMDKMLFRATGLGSIFYKTSTEPGSIWSPGLYFADKVGQVLGYIGSDNKTKVLWGNQVNGPTTYVPTGTAISPDIPMGYRYAENGGVLTFNSEGLPWMRVSNRLLSIDKDGKVVARQTGSTGAQWHTATTPSTSSMYVSGGRQNLAMKKDSIVFLMGKYTSPLNILTDDPKISAFNFTSDTVTNILGPVGGPTPAPDQSTPTDLRGFNLSSVCISSYCALQFIENDPALETDDELFFIEGLKIRKITNPLNPGAQTLHTVFSVTPDFITIPWGATGDHNQIANFFVTPDKSRIFFLSENKIYCTMINGNISKWCNETALGPFAGAGDIPKLPSQFTMMDSDTLLISTGRVVLRFDFPLD
nr:hypothetical protein BdHM001_20120 [Bdellovibrio sp. HM001]